MLFLLGFGCCQESQGVVVGLSTSILCSLSARRNINVAPFWFINGTVYELFSIPRHFPFIPVVDSYSHLTIPNVPLTVDQTTFQCARFSENGLDNGDSITLSVVQGKYWSRPGQLRSGLPAQVKNQRCVLAGHS